MAKFSLCIFTVAVLFGGITADLLCILKETMIITPDHFITHPDRACRNLDTKFDRARQEFKKCLGFELDISKLEALHHEFCNPDSDFRQKVNRQRYCISSNIPNSMTCLSSIDTSPNLEHENILRKSIFDTCHSLSVDMSKCLADKVGGPCGAEGLEVYGRIAQVSESIFTASCFSVAKMALEDDELAAEIERAEHKVVEASLRDDSDSDEYMKAAATAHSALIWCILLGLLFAARW